MKCYYHKDVEAVGVCKGCGKAICHESSQEVSSNLFCKDSDCSKNYSNNQEVDYPRYFKLGLFNIPVSSKKIREFDNKYKKIIVPLIWVFLAIIVFAMLNIYIY